jgi:hypothetical protein
MRSRVRGKGWKGRMPEGRRRRGSRKRKIGMRKGRKKSSSRHRS